MTNSQQRTWKDYLDMFLLFNLVVIFGGFFLFLAGVIASSTGNMVVYQIFQKLWLPLFIPAISTFFTAVFIQALWNRLPK